MLYAAPAITIYSCFIAALPVSYTHLTLPTIA